MKVRLEYRGISVHLVARVRVGKRGSSAKPVLVGEERKYFPGRGSFAL